MANSSAGGDFRAHRAFGKIADSCADWGALALAPPAHAHAPLPPARSARRVRWAVLEKIHGAHLALVADVEAASVSSAVLTPDALRVRAAKRGTFLAPDECFFGAADVLARHAPAVAKLAARLLLQDCCPFVRVSVFGELFGGLYPSASATSSGGGGGGGIQDDDDNNDDDNDDDDDDDVYDDDRAGGPPRPSPAPVPVQTEILYTVRAEFLAFDVALEDATGSTRVFIDWERAAALLDEAGVPRCENLAVVPTLADALAHPLDFPSTIPARFGLPPLRGNAAEGVVVKPLRELRVQTRHGEERAILKRKAARFCELVAGAGGRGRAGAGLDPLSVALLPRLNTNRLASVRSKAGLDVPRAALLALLLADALEDVAETCAPDDRALGRAARAVLAEARESCGDAAGAHPELLFWGSGGVAVDPTALVDGAVRARAAEVLHAVLDTGAHDGRRGGGGKVARPRATGATARARTRRHSADRR